MSGVCLETSDTVVKHDEEEPSALRSAEAALQESETARRELACCLITAQENERTRIARELHDDIGQSLAILKIRLLKLASSLRGAESADNRSVEGLGDDLTLIIEKVSRLSHRLHSAELEYLGLAVAIQSHCREVAEQYNIPVECSCENIPENLDSLSALNLLRVLQEALHNAIKHSEAHLIKVAARGAETHLMLEITDDGIGFNVERARLARGLGLISMRERVFVVGGEFKIESAPGAGTRISACVPCLPQSDKAQPQGRMQ